jgi:phospholipid/cholesterol/gamma-HCH transport system substrate-binding protein
MNSTRYMLLGAFFVIVLGILGYFTLFMTEFSLFARQHSVVVQFPDANGLRQGDSVQIAGMRQGRVAELVFDPSAPLASRITVTLKLDQVLNLYEGFSIVIHDSTLLGGKVVEIDPGAADGARVATDVALSGKVARNPLAAVGDLVDENRESFARVMDNLDLLIDNLLEGKGTVGRLLRDEEMAADLKDGVAKFQRSADNLAVLTDDVRAGKGTIGRLFTDEELAAKLGDIGDQLASITKDFQGVAKDLAEGKGTIGRLLKDEKVSEDVAKAIETIRSMFDKINTGEGTLGRLIVDPAIADDLKELIASMRRGDNTIGKLFTSSEIYDKLAKVADDLSVVTDAIRNAKGSVGKLIMDDGLYEQLQRALQTVTQGLEEYREAAPITTFAGVLFGAL